MKISELPFRKHNPAISKQENLFGFTGILYLTPVLILVSKNGAGKYPRPAKIAPQPDSYCPAAAGVVVDLDSTGFPAVARRKPMYIKTAPNSSEI